MPEHSQINKFGKGTMFSSFSEFQAMKTFPDTKPLVLINLNSKIEYVNKPFVELFKLEIGDSLNNLKTDPDINAVIFNLIEKKYSSFHFDIYVNSSGEGFFVEIERVFIKNKSFFLILFSSIAERKKIEERINYLHYALEYGFLPVITLTPEGKLNYSSSPFEKILDKPIQELYGKHIVKLLSPFIDETEQKKLKAAIRKSELWKTVVKHQTGKGEVFYEFVLKPIKHHEEKNAGFVVVANDVTDHVLRLRITEKNEKRQRLILNSISEPLIIIRKKEDKFYFENANEIFYKMFDIANKETEEYNFFDFPDEKIIDLVLTAIDRMEFEKKSYLKVNFSHDAIKRQFICKFSSFSCTYEQSSIYVVSFFDITKQLETEKMLRESYEKEMRLNKLKSAFLANMSHEIRTPLNAIIGYADLLNYEVKNLGNEMLSELTTYLKDGAKRLVKLVENIIDVSRIEAGEFELSYSEVNIAEIFERFGKEFFPTASLRGIVLLFDIDKDSAVIETDETVFEKLFWELLDNAIKYNIEKGKVIVRGYSIGDMVRIEVIDTGRGISKEMISEVLQPFTQDDLEGYRRKHEGAGLGLTFAYKVTKLMGGEFEIQSEIGEGTKIIVTLPSKKPFNFR